MHLEQIVPSLKEHVFLTAVSWNPETAATQPGYTQGIVVLQCVVCAKLLFINCTFFFTSGMKVFSGILGELASLVIKLPSIYLSVNHFQEMVLMLVFKIAEIEFITFICMFIWN